MTRRLLHKIHGELAAVFPKLREDFFRRGNGAVPEAAGGGDDEQFFRRGVERGRLQRGKEQNGQHRNLNLVLNLNRVSGKIKIMMTIKIKSLLNGGENFHFKFA